MKKSVLVFSLAAVAVFAMHSVALATGEGWIDNFEQAKKQAAAEGKDILIDFSGSDWCGWCIKLDQEVFQQEVFQAAAPKDFILVSLDFPRDKSKVDDETAKQNKHLMEVFAVRGFPTLFLTDATGRPYAKMGYKAGGPENYLKYLTELKATGQARAKEFAAANSEKDTLTKARRIDALLEALDSEMVTNFYEDEIQQIIALDADNTAGLKRKYGEMTLASKISRLLSYGKFDEASRVMEEIVSAWALPEIEAVELKKEYEQKIFVERMDRLMRGGQYKAVISTTEKWIAEKKPEDQALLNMQLRLAKSYALNEDSEKAIELLDSVIKRNNLKGTALQNALQIKYIAYSFVNDEPNRNRIMKEIVAADPDSELAKKTQKRLDR